MRLSNKMDLLLLWDVIGSTNVPPATVLKDCYLFGQEIGKELISTQGSVSSTLSRYSFIETAKTDYEKSVRLGMFDVIERNLESIVVDLNDVITFVKDTLAVCHITPPNHVYLERGFILLQRIHGDFLSRKFQGENLNQLLSLADGAEGDEKVYNTLEGCNRYIHQNIL